MKIITLTGIHAERMKEVKDMVKVQINKAKLSKVKSNANVMKYKGYVGMVECDLKAGILFGRVVNKDIIVTFRGESIEDVRQSFIDSVDTYLEYCKEIGEKP